MGLIEEELRAKASIATVAGDISFTNDNAAMKTLPVEF
jgi:hypothetical protein